MTGQPPQGVFHTRIPRPLGHGGRLRLMCASPHCSLRVHSWPELGAYCCLNCASGEAHGKRCECALPPENATRADPNWKPEWAPGTRLGDLDDVRSTSAYKKALKKVGAEKRVKRGLASERAGTSLMKRRDPVKALEKYAHGLELTEPLFGRSPEQIGSSELQKDAEAVYLSLQLGALEACLKLKDWKAADEHACKALLLDRGNLRGFRGRAVAAISSDVEDHIERAYVVLAQLVQLDTTNKSLKQYLKQAQSRLRNYYTDLGLRQHATEKQIRQAYYNAARRWHPDKVHDEEKKAFAEKRFKEVHEAYEVLFDSEHRRYYDLYLKCRKVGYVEVAYPEDPPGIYKQVHFQGWREFRLLPECNVPPVSSWRAAEQDEDDDEIESHARWLLVGGALATAFLCTVAFRLVRRSR